MQDLKKPISRDLIETILVVLLFIGLIYALYHVLEVFFGILTFALIFAVSFSKPYERMVLFFRGRRKLTSIIYSLILIAIVALPLTFLIAAMSRHLKLIIQWIPELKAHGLPPLPAFVSRLPFGSDYIKSFWADFKDSPRETLLGHQRQINIILHHIVSAGFGIIGVAIQFLLGIIISAFLLERGDSLLLPVKDAIRHLVNEDQGNSLLEAMNLAIKGVSIGVMGTGFIASFIAWTGLILAGIPFAGGLAALIFFLVIIQIGPMVIWIPLIIWEGLQGNHTTTIILLVYLVIITAVDLVIKPVLIARSGGKLPFLVLFLGVVGGLAAWGFTGMFKGAIITAIFYTLYTTWLERKKLGDLQG